MSKPCRSLLRCAEVAASILAVALALLLCIVPAYARAQEARAEKLSFDVASLRENKTQDDSVSSNVPLGPGDVYSPTGGLLTVKNMPLMNYISFAYRMTSTQLTTFAAAAPSWVQHDRFNLQARTEKNDVTKDQLRLMMRSLLADRFGLAVHYETRLTPVLAMQIIRPGKLGPRLRPHPADGCSRDFSGPKEAGIAPQSETIDGGFPAVCGGLLMMGDSTPTHFHIGARDVPVSLISNALPSWGDLGRPVVDQTGLTGSYDFALDFAPKRGDPQTEAGAPQEAEQPSFLDALKQQLGLKLEAQKQGVQVLVLDRIDHLNEN